MTFVHGGKRVSVSVLPTRTARALVISHCCTNENQIGGQHYISVALVLKATLDAERMGQYRESLLAPEPDFTEGQPRNYNMREFALESTPPVLPDLPDNKMWIVNLSHQITFTGEIERLLPYRQARMSVVDRDRLRQKLMWLLGRPEESDIAELATLGIVPASP